MDEYNNTYYHSIYKKPIGADFLTLSEEIMNCERNYEIMNNWIMKLLNLKLVAGSG